MELLAVYVSMTLLLQVFHLLHLNGKDHFLGKTHFMFNVVDLGVACSCVTAASAFFRLGLLPQVAELRVHGLAALLLGSAIVSASFVLRLQPLAGLALLNYASGLPIVFAAVVLPKEVNGRINTEHCFSSC